VLDLYALECPRPTTMLSDFATDTADVVVLTALAEGRDAELSTFGAVVRGTPQRNQLTFREAIANPHWRVLDAT
jgi:hypothetical protein